MGSPLAGGSLLVVAILLSLRATQGYAAAPPVPASPDGPTFCFLGWHWGRSPAPTVKEFHKALVGLTFWTNDPNVASRKWAVMMAKPVVKDANRVQIDVFECQLTEKRFKATIERPRYSFSWTDQGVTSITWLQTAQVFGYLERLPDKRGWKAKISWQWGTAKGVQP